MAEPSSRLLKSADGTELALHDFGGTGTTLLFVHATGFHSHCYLPMAAELRGNYHCFGIDVRGHGASAVPDGWEVDWSAFGDDALAAAESLAEHGPVVGFGHSMGGASLIMAASRRPNLLDSIILFEPIAFPPNNGAFDETDTPIVRGALRRRRTFRSVDEAYENYRAKRPMSEMVPEALRAYVEHGFRPGIDADGGDVVELRCPPELEAGIFMRGHRNGVWDLLEHTETRATVLGGRIERAEPASVSQAVADRLMNGRYVSLPYLSHFGPFSHPGEVARQILAHSEGTETL